MIENIRSVLLAPSGAQRVTICVCLPFQPIFRAENLTYNYKASQILFRALSQTRTILTLHTYSSTVTERRSLENFKNWTNILFHIQGGAGRGLPWSQLDQGLWRGVFPRPRLFPPPLQILTPEQYHHNIRPGTAAASRPSPGWSRGNENQTLKLSRLRTKSQVSWSTII